MKTMNLKKSLLFFGIPGAIMFLLCQFVYPYLVQQYHMAVCWATFFCVWSPLLVMIAIIFFQYQKSGERFGEFFWVQALQTKQILIVLAAFLVVQAAESMLAFSRPLLASLPGFHVPAFYPDLFRLDFAFEIPLKSLLGIEVAGNYFVLFFWLLWIVVNIGCEEMLWRAYALPRMERHFGKWAWLVNGLLWNICIHFFMRWSFITLLPVTLTVPYLSQRYRSLWPGVIIHGLGNLLLFIMIIPSVLM